MLKIKDNVNLKELEKFGFIKEIKKEKTHKYKYRNGEEDYYTEILYKYDNGINTIEILERRKNSDWRHINQEREIYVYESDYEMGISKDMISIIYDLIQAKLVEKV
jgi:hypothetical protein